ncbi:MAG: Ni/Fe-hydrogenase cytochrome b subunit [Desulfobulbus sp.]|jgi:Ni/Fe-hydrogenase subunit HybB-like protein
MSDAKPLGGRILTPTFLVCLLVIGVAGYYTYKRFLLGIGAVANLNDGFPWGLWISYDVVVGSAFACGGYVMALMVYVFNGGRFHPLVRPALLASMFGYSLAGVSVLVDIGRYFNVYNLYLPWQINLHSVMLEVALCITTYVFVMWLEFAPAFVEKWKLTKFGAVLDKVVFVLIALGVLLPTMHQSSLGTMMLMAGYKLSPLWHTSTLPLLFLFTALFMGFAMVIFEGTLSGRVYRLEDETHLLAKIGKIIAYLIGVYLILRLQNIFVRGAMPEAFSGSFLGYMFLLENALLLGGMFILAYPGYRHSPRLLFIAAVLVLCGGALFRFNTYIIGYNPGTGWKYFPSIGEQMITYGLIALEIAGYMLFVKFFPVFSAGHKSAAPIPVKE